MTDGADARRMVGAALDAVVAGAHAGASVSDLVAAGLDAAGHAYGSDLAAAGLDAAGHAFGSHLVAAGSDAAGHAYGSRADLIRLSISQVGGGEHLRKSALLIVRLQAGQRRAARPIEVDVGDEQPVIEPLEVTRTLVVGFDTLEADAVAADRAVRALSAAMSAARAGATLRSVRAAAADGTDDVVVRVERRGAPVHDESPEALAVGDRLYVEVATRRPGALGESASGWPCPDPTEPRGVVLGDTILVMATHAEAVGGFAVRLWL